MKLNNFVYKRMVGTNIANYRFYATVDVTTGFLFWKKTENRKITRTFGDYWIFSDNGDMCPPSADCLESCYTAGQYKTHLHECKFG